MRLRSAVVASPRMASSYRLKVASKPRSSSKGLARLFFRVRYERLDVVTDACIVNTTRLVSRSTRPQSNRVSGREPLLFGETDFRDQRRTAAMASLFSAAHLQRPTARSGSRQIGAFRTSSGNLWLETNAWWSLEDSNLSPTRYGSPLQITLRGGLSRLCALVTGFGPALSPENWTVLA